MPTEIRCPKCASENVRFSKEHSRYDCEDCAHEFLPGKPFVSKRVFVSYGHDEHAPLAIRLRDDLRTRGHDVWFDAERLQPGHDWEAFIEKGLEHLAADKANSAVLLLLTPHSVRRPDGQGLRIKIIKVFYGETAVPHQLKSAEMICGFDFRGGCGGNRRINHSYRIYLNVSCVSPARWLLPKRNRPCFGSRPAHHSADGRRERAAIVDMPHTVARHA